MIARTPSIFIMVLFLFFGSACQFADRLAGEEGNSTPQNADRPSRPLYSTLDVAQENIPPDPPGTTGEDGASSVEAAFSGDLDTAISSTVEALLSAINIRRALNGWHPLIRQALLMEMANHRAIDMSVHGYLGHEDPETAENQVERMLVEQGYYGNVAELVYAASVPLDRLSEIAIDEWFEDPDTRAVLLSPGFRFIGIGIMGDGTTWKIVQVLAESGP